MRRFGLAAAAVAGLAFVTAGRSQAFQREPGGTTARPGAVHFTALGERLLAVSEPVVEKGGRLGYRLTAYQWVGDRFVRSGSGFHPSAGTEPEGR
jgi:hypothetical protein